MKNRQFKSGIYAVISTPQQDTIEGFFESTRESDVVSIVGHRLSAHDVELLRDLCGTTLILNTGVCVEPMRFDLMRNFALAQLPPDVTVAVSLDADERLNGGWSNELERASSDVDEAIFSYHYTDPQFNGLRYLKTSSSRIHSRHGFHYSGATHEFLVPSRGGHVNILETAIEIRHISSRANFESKVARYTQLMNQGSQDLDIIQFNHEFRNIRQLMWSRNIDSATICEKVAASLRRLSEKPDTLYWRSVKDEFLAVSIFARLADANGSTIHRAQIAQDFAQMSDRNLYDIGLLIK